MGRCHHEALPCPPSEERAWRGLHGLGWGAQPLGVKTAVPMWRAVSSGLTLGVTSRAAIFPAITTLVWAGGAVTGGRTTAPRKHIPDEVMVCVCHREQTLRKTGPLSRPGSEFPREGLHMAWGLPPGGGVWGL